MINRQNLHSHSLYCDGKNTLREMTESAIAHGLSSLGFSSHAWTGFPFDDCGIAKDEIDRYFQEIDALDNEYKDRIKLYKAFEYESRDIYGFDPVIDPRCDYSIGSVHFFWLDGEALPIDLSPDAFEEAAGRYGSIRLMARSYYDEVVRFSGVSDYTITGHFDLITKFIEKTHMTFEEEKWYQDMAIDALDAVIENGKIFEINTGAIGRGYRTSPYPAPFLLSRLIERKVPLILTSDCHNAPDITCHFEESEALVRSLGGKELYAFDGRAFNASGI